MAVLKVLLLILKILGITILAILGLVLLLLLLVLFVPVRYKGSFLRKEDPAEMKLNTVVSWSNPLIRFRLWMEEKKVHYTVRILGFCIKNSDKAKKEKPEKEKKPKKEKKSKQKKSTKKREETEVNSNVIEESHVENEIKELPDKNMEETEPTKVENTTEFELPEEDSQDTFEEHPEEEDEKQLVFAKIGEKIKAVLEKIKGVIDKIKAIPEKIRKKIESIKANILLLIRKKDAVLRFISKEGNKAVFGSAFGLLGKLLRHILPRKLKGSIVFGTGDPESTGKALGIAAMFYPVYAKSFTIQPDFTEKRIEADITFRGKIRLATLLWMLARFWWGKETKRFRKEYKKLKKVLKEKAE